MALKTIAILNHRNLSLYKMNKVFYEGAVPVKPTDLNLDLTLLGGQSFRWRKVEESETSIAEWHGVAYNAYWILKQTNTELLYTVYPDDKYYQQIQNTEYFKSLLFKYLRLDFDLMHHVEKWRKCHKHFDNINAEIKAVRVLNQEPLENIISFICSQNNHIKRISSMVEWFCSKYGRLIGKFNNRNEYSFPSLDELISSQDKLEESLRLAKFGYRAKFLAKTIQKIQDFGGGKWLDELRNLPYKQSRLELVKLPGIGYKVADCICLMSLNHLQSVPIDTHLYKIAQNSYLPHLAKIKNITPKIYEEIADNFREIYGCYAGWAQAVLFCSELQQFQMAPETTDAATSTEKPRLKTKRNCKS